MEGTGLFLHARRARVTQVGKLVFMAWRHVPVRDGVSFTRVHERWMWIGDRCMAVESVSVRTPEELVK